LQTGALKIGFQIRLMQGRFKPFPRPACFLKARGIGLGHRHCPARRAGRMIIGNGGI